MNKKWPTSVIVALPQNGMRSQLTKTLRESGIPTVHSVPDLQAANEILEVEQVDWLWSTLYRDGDINLFQVLDLICATPDLKGTRCSAFFGADEQDFILSAFEFGLLTWHKLPTTVAETTSALAAAQQLCARHDRISPLAAGQQLSALLAEKKQQEPRRHFLRDLATLYPNRAYPVLATAEAELEAGNKGAGGRALQLARAQGFEGWQPLAKKYFRADLSQTPAKTYDVRSYVVVEPDETIHNHIDALMRPFDARRALHFSDSNSALRWLESNSHAAPDLIIQEWKLPDVSGPNFLQRARQLGVKDVPILVVSSLVNKADEPLLREMGVARTVQKPLIDHEFLSSISDTLREYHEPDSDRFIERRILGLLEAGHLPRARIEVQRILEAKTYSKTLCCYVQGVLRYYEGDFAEAKEHLSRCLTTSESRELGTDKSVYLNALARCLVRMRDFQGAARCYEKAQEMSPKNILRLLELAETYAEAGNKKGAEESLHRAATLDADNPEVQCMQIRHALTYGKKTPAKIWAIPLVDKKRLVSDLNNAGVSMVKTGQISKGIALYNQTLGVVNEQEGILWVRVRYNLALAQAKAGQTQEALTNLSELKTSSALAGASPPASEGAQLARKIDSLCTKLQRHTSHGEPLELAASVGADAARTSINESFWSRIGGPVRGPTLGSRYRPRAAPGARPGERCLHMVYTAPDTLVPVAALGTLLQTRLSYHPRTAITKAPAPFRYTAQNFEDDH